MNEEHPRNENDPRDEIELFLRDAYAAGCNAAQTKSLFVAFQYAAREAPKLRAIIAAQCNGEWRPIETAPKDGGRFLAYQREEGVDFYHWQDFGPDSTAPKGWRDSFITVYPDGAANGPTHWMSLPEPPK